MSKPLIGISSRLLQTTTPGFTAAGVYTPYLESIIAAGGAPVIFPFTEDTAALKALYDLVAGVLLTGGEDIDPVHYKEEPHSQLGRVDQTRDTAELNLTRWAVGEKKPLLAICRGIQVLNVALGGSLFQDLPSQVKPKIDHDQEEERDKTSHLLKLEQNSKLAQVLGTDTIWANSMHHQAINGLAPGLKVSAKSEDGIIEAVEGSGNSFVLGVQCHPELLWQNTNRDWLKLFSSFVDSARAFKNA